MLRAAIFDLDGTLVDSRRAVVDAVAAGVREVLDRHAVGNVEPRDEDIMAAMGLPPHEYYQRILPEELHHLAPEVKEASTRHEVEALADGRGRLYPGVRETLTALKAQGVRLAVISNAQEPYFVAAVRYLGLSDLMDHAECHEQLPDGVGQGKPVLLRRALDILRVDPPLAVMVGDRREDIAAGLALGCRTMGLLYGFGSDDEIEDAEIATGDFSRLEEFFR
jgi:phosphoglycolate phosphatase-like HAD superfamily hydrolase